jgi:hypothetical protein
MPLINGQRPTRRNPGGRSCLVIALTVIAVAIGALSTVNVSAKTHAPTSYDYRYYWKDNLTVGGWAETSWITDNHGDGALETRVYCVDAIAPYDDYWSTSGAVRETGIWAKTPNCGGFTTATFAQAREAVPTGAPWGPWGTFDARKILTSAKTNCTEKWTGNLGPPGNAFVYWNTNTCFWELRVKIHCENTVSEFTVNQYGGWVMSNIHSGATCPANEPALEDAYAQYRVATGDPITTVQFYAANPLTAHPHNTASSVTAQARATTAGQSAKGDGG